VTPEQFVYWLQGFVEISGKTELDATQLKIVQDHLDLVLTKVTPERRPVEQKKCENKLPPELEALIKEATEELHKPISKRRMDRIFRRKETPGPKPQLRCTGPINHAWPSVLDTHTYC